PSTKYGVPRIGNGIEVEKAYQVKLRCSHAAGSDFYLKPLHAAELIGYAGVTDDFVVEKGFPFGGKNADGKTFPTTGFRHAAIDIKLSDERLNEGVDLSDYYVDIDGFTDVISFPDQEND